METTIVTFRVIKKPKDDYTAIGFPVGSSVSFNILDYKDVIVLNFGQGNGASFLKDELEPIAAKVTTTVCIEDKETLMKLLNKGTV